MPQFDANTDAPTLFGFHSTYADLNVVETLESDIIDTADMKAFTFVVQFDLRLLNPASPLITTNAQLLMSDDPGFATSEVVDAENLIGDISELNIDSGTLGQFHYFGRVGAFATKRYVRLSVDADYTAVIAGLAGVYGHVQYRPTVIPVA